MSFGIAGIFKTAEQKNVRQMLDKISHRGQLGPEIIETNNATIGIIYSAIESDLIKYLKDNKFPDNLFPVQIKNNNLILERDALGKTPMYYGLTDDNIFCFGSEVKSLLVKTCNVYEFPPGYSYENNNFIQKHIYQKQPAKIQDAQIIADELRQLLSNTIKSQIKNNIAGAWLSGGLDSSAIAGLACKHTKELHTFAIGLSNSPDLRFARIAADYLQSHNQNLYRHHEVIVDMKDILQNLPDAIYHLESFDALLVRSSVTNYIISKTAAEFVSEVFSGEGGDELFAGYSYLKTLNPLFLEDELIDIMNRLHNTALQRVDRCASAFGLTAYVPFASPEVVNYALQIPIEYKLNNGIEKWILRKALQGLLPETILNRTKAKFWEGTGIADSIGQYANQHISDTEFNNESLLPCGWKLNSKEELFYYRIFKEHFGELNNLDWMGQTKSV